MDEKLSGRNIAVVSLEGNIHEGNCDEIKHRIESLIEEGKINIIVDLSRVPDMDSSGIGIFISLLDRVGKMNGTLKLASIQPFVMDVINISGLSKVFENYNSVNEASASYE